MRRQDNIILSNARTLLTTVMFFAFSLGHTAIAQFEIDHQRTRDEVVGILAATQLSLHADQASTTDVFQALSLALGLDLIIQYRKSYSELGIDPDLLITLDVNQLPAIVVLEMIMEQCSVVDPYTWQISPAGHIEIGSKRQLAARNSRETRSYQLADLLLEPLYVDATPKAEERLRAQQQMLRQNPLHVVSLGDDIVKRKNSSHITREIIRSITDFIEPGNWDVILPDNPKPGSRFDPNDWKKGRTRRITGQRADTSRTSTIQASAKMAQIQRYKSKLMITAPDFIHRQVGGYPNAIWPRSEPPETLLDRSTRASAVSDRCSIENHGLISSPGADPRKQNRNRYAAAHLMNAISKHFESERTKMARQLLSTVVTLDFTALPTRAAFEQLSNQIGITIIGRYDDDQFGYGLHPSTQITLQAQEIPAIEALELILRRSEPELDEKTWQLRAGFIEVGTKRRLNVEAAQDLRIYEIRDLLTHLPNYHTGERLRPDLLALDLAEEIINTVEKGQWDYGQIDYEHPEEEEAESEERDEYQEYRDRDPLWEPDGTQPIVPEPDRNKVDDPNRNAKGMLKLPDYVRPRRPATLRYWRGHILVKAPDYIHRALAGYPTNN